MPSHEIGSRPAKIAIGNREKATSHGTNTPADLRNRSICQRCKLHSTSDAVINGQ